MGCGGSKSAVPVAQENVPAAYKHEKIEETKTAPATDSRDSTLSLTQKRIQEIEKQTQEQQEKAPQAALARPDSIKFSQRLNSSGSSNSLTPTSPTKTAIPEESVPAPAPVLETVTEAVTLPVPVAETASTPAPVAENAPTSPNNNGELMPGTVSSAVAEAKKRFDKTNGSLPSFYLNSPQSLISPNSSNSITSGGFTPDKTDGKRFGKTNKSDTHAVAAAEILNEEHKPIPEIIKQMEDAAAALKTSATSGRDVKGTSAATSPSTSHSTSVNRTAPLSPSTAAGVSVSSSSSASSKQLASPSSLRNVSTPASSTPATTTAAAGNGGVIKPSTPKPQLTETSSSSSLVAQGRARFGSSNKIATPK